MKRIQNSNGLENYGRYMASAEIADLRGVSAVPVSFRAGALLTAAKRDFIWWLQGESLADGGFRRVACELLEMFPERIGTAAMHKARVQAGKMYSDSLAPYDYADALRDFGNGEKPEQISGDKLVQICRRKALIWRELKSESWQPRVSLCELSIEQFLVELCINPKVIFALPEGDPAADELETELALESDPSLSRYDFKPAALSYFKDIIGALVEYRARRQRAIRENFYVTAIGRQIWNQLDFALRTKSMVLVYGREGRGKTEAVKAWAELHSGQARFVSLNGIATKTAAFREIASALGISHSYNLTGSALQSRIEDVLKRSKLMLLIDEAHALFSQSQRTKARPEMIDWLDTAFANCRPPLPVALCTTPQFMDCMARAAYQVEWNYNQFRRRVKRWISLPEENTEADIAGVAGKIFAGANAAVIKKVISYVFASGRDLSALGDVATELRALLGTSDFSKATFKQVDQIIRENLYPSDNAFITEMEIARQKLPKGRKQPAPALPIEADLVEPEPREPISQAQPAEPPGVNRINRPRADRGYAPASGQNTLETDRLEGALTAH